MDSDLYSRFVWGPADPALSGPRPPDSDPALRGESFQTSSIRSDKDLGPVSRFVFSEVTPIERLMERPRRAVRCCVEADFSSVFRATSLFPPALVLGSVVVVRGFVGEGRTRSVFSSHVRVGVASKVIPARAAAVVQVRDAAPGRLWGRHNATVVARGCPG